MTLVNSKILQLCKKVNVLLTVDQRRQGRILVFLMIIGMLFETLSIGMVVPAVALMSTPDIGEGYSAIQNLILFTSGPANAPYLTMMGILLLVSIYAIKALFLVFLARRQGRFTFGLQSSLSQRLFDAYLHQPYVFHLQRNSAQLVRNVTYETNMFIHSFVMPVLTIITEALVLAGIVTVLLLVEPIGATLVVLSLSVTGFVFYKTMRTRILTWGEARQWHDGLRLQYLQEGLNGVKDVKFFGKESEFLGRFALHNGASINMDKNQIVLQQLPRLILEFIAVSALGMLVVIMLMQGKTAESIIPTVGLFAAAAFRMMPSANRIFSSSQSLRYALPVLHNLHSEIEQLKQFHNDRESMVSFKFFGQIEINAVSYCYPEAKIPSISDISLTINRGDSIGFIGGSGAGKSTLVNIILGLLTPSKGSILVGGQDIQVSLRDWRNIVGYVPQSIFLTDDTLKRNIAFGIPEDQIDDAAIKRAVHAAQLGPFVDTLAEGLNTFVGERGARLSGGQLQRIGIARALYHDPEVLVLDEATSALDNATEKGVMEAIRALRGEKTILIVAHRLSTVVDCDFIYRLHHGTIVDAGVTAVILDRNLSNGTNID